jgi:hypothetical protein
MAERHGRARRASLLRARAGGRGCQARPTVMSDDLSGPERRPLFKYLQEHPRHGWASKGGYRCTRQKIVPSHAPKTDFPLARLNSNVRLLLAGYTRYRHNHKRLSYLNGGDGPEGEADDASFRRCVFFTCRRRAFPALMPTIPSCPFTVPSCLCFSGRLQL